MDKQSSKKIILGSNSPRRKELLAGLNLEFTVDTGNSFEEMVEPGTRAADVPALMSRGKSYGFHRALGIDEILITADTVVIVDDKAMGKPHSRIQAVEMLQELSGKSHVVITAVTVRSSEREETLTDSTIVTFKELSLDEINYYIDNYEPFDKAGSYGVQEWIGYIGITRIEGSFYNVMGFPVHRVYDVLKRFTKLI